MISSWKNPYLIQRLKKPIESPEILNPYNFGGGYLYGGFKKESLVKIQKIFRFDYMGSAEFEFGDVPKSFMRIIEHVKRNELIIKSIKIKNKIVYVLVPNQIEKEATNYIKLLAIKGDYYSNRKNRFEIINLKEPSHLRRELESQERDKNSTIGWIDIENDFMFFIDEDVFENTTKLFGLEK